MKLAILALVALAAHAQAPLPSPVVIGSGGGGGGGGTIAHTTNALIGDGSGNALAATGTGTNCLLVNGTSTACSGGGGGATGPATSIQTNVGGTSNGFAGTTFDTQTFNIAGSLFTTLGTSSPSSADPNFHRAQNNAYTSSAEGLNTGFPTESALYTPMNLLYGWNDTDGIGKLTSVAHDISLFSPASGQRFAIISTLTCIGMGDCFGQANNVTQYGGLNDNGGEGTGIINSRVEQGRHLARQTIVSVGTPSGALTTITPAVSVSVNTAISAAMTSGQTSITTVSNLPANGSYLGVGGECMLLTAGGTTTSGTVTRAAITNSLCSAAAAHLISTPVIQYQNVVVGTTIAPHVIVAGDWVTIQRGNIYTTDGSEEITQVLFVPDATHMVAFFEHSHTAGAAVNSATILNLDGSLFFGQWRYVVNLGGVSTGISYSTGTGSPTTGSTNITGAGGANWNSPSGPVGGDATLPGLISFNADTYSGNPFASTPLVAWYGINSIDSNTSGFLAHKSDVGIAGYSGLASNSGATYTIRAGARLARIFGNQVILEYNTFAWAAGDLVECAMSVDGVMTPTQNFAWWMPGATLHGSDNVTNNGARTIDDAFGFISTMETGGNADVEAYKTGFFMGGKVRDQLIQADLQITSGRFSDRQTYSGDNKYDQWRSPNGSGGAYMGLDYTTANWFLSRGPSPNFGISFDLSGTSSTPVVLVPPAASGTLARLSDIATPGSITISSFGGAVGDAQILGKFTPASTAGTMTVYLTARDVSTSNLISKVYQLASSTNTGAYVLVPSISQEIKGSDDIQLEFFNNSDQNLRLVQTAGTDVMTVYIFMNQPTPSAATFVPCPSSCTSTGVTPSTTPFEGSFAPFLYTGLSSATAKISPSGLTANRTFTLPDASGTISLIGSALEGTIYCPGGGTYPSCTASAASVTVDPVNGKNQSLLLTAATATAVTLTQPATGSATVVIKIKQASTPTGTVTWTTCTLGTSGTCWPSGIAPVITASASAADWVSCKLDGLNAYCTAAQNFQ